MSSTLIQKTSELHKQIQSVSALQTAQQKQLDLNKESIEKLANEMSQLNIDLGSSTEKLIRLDKEFDEKANGTLRKINISPSESLRPQQNEARSSFAVSSLALGLIAAIAGYSIASTDRKSISSFLSGCGGFLFGSAFFK